MTDTTEQFRIIPDASNPNNLRIMSGTDRHICKVYGYTPEEAQAKAERIVAGLSASMAREDEGERAVAALHPAWFASDYNWREAQKAIRAALTAADEDDNTCPRCLGCGEMDAGGAPCMVCGGRGIIDAGEDEAERVARVICRTYHEKVGTFPPLATEAERRAILDEEWPKWLDEARAAIAASHPNVAMREALKPFAAVADEYDEGEDDAYEVWQDAGPVRLIRASFRLGLYRMARAALNGSDKDRDGPVMKSEEERDQLRAGRGTSLDEDRKALERKITTLQMLLARYGDRVRMANASAWQQEIDEALAGRCSKCGGLHLGMAGDCLGPPRIPGHTRESVEPELASIIHSSMSRDFERRETLSPDRADEVEELRFWLRKAGAVLAPYSADPAGTPTRDALVFVNAGLFKQARDIVRTYAPEKLPYGNVLELRKALEKCRHKFLHYADLHRMKCTAEGDEKADRNQEMADMCATALGAGRDMIDTE